MSHGFLQFCSYQQGQSSPADLGLNSSLFFFNLTISSLKDNMRCSFSSVTLWGDTDSYPYTEWMAVRLESLGFDSFKSDQAC